MAKGVAVWFIVFCSHFLQGNYLPKEGSWGPRPSFL